MDIFDPPKYVECNIDNQLDVLESMRKLRSFIFRGHGDSSWGLSSSIEREFKKYPKSQMIEGAEQSSIDYFKKRAQLYGFGLNKDSELPDIISSMQHHGCPTRLIDFTKSFYIATYFAVCDPNIKSHNYSIWALNNPIIQWKAKELASTYFNSDEIDVDIKLKEFSYKLLAFKPDGVVPIEAETISRRMSAQQGILLAQTNMHRSFISNLCSMLKIDSTSKPLKFEEFQQINQNIINSIYIIKFNFSSTHLQAIRRELLSLNVTSENVFPDLNGLAKSAVEHLFWQY